MASPSKSKSEFVLGLNASETRVLLLGIVCVDASGKIDYEKLAVKGGWKNRDSASTTYRNARRKFEQMFPKDESAESSAAGGADAAVGSPSTPKKTPARRGKKAAAADADADEASSPKPKRQRKTPVKKAALAAATTDTAAPTDAVKAEDQEKLPITDPFLSSLFPARAPPMASASIIPSISIAPLLDAPTSASSTELIFESAFQGQMMSDAELSAELAGMEDASPPAPALQRESGCEGV